MKKLGKVMLAAAITFGGGIGATQLSPSKAFASDFAGVSVNTTKQYYNATYEDRNIILKIVNNNSYLVHVNIEREVLYNGQWVSPIGQVSFYMDPTKETQTIALSKPSDGTYRYKFTVKKKRWNSDEYDLVGSYYTNEIYVTNIVHIPGPSETCTLHCE